MKPISSSLPTRKPARPRPWRFPLPVLAAFLGLGLGLCPGTPEPARAQGVAVTDDLGRSARTAFSVQFPHKADLGSRGSP